MENLLEVNNLSVSFRIRKGVLKAVEDISFTVAKGETLGIVGESGSGKSVCCHAVTGLIPTPPGTIDCGSALFAGKELLHRSDRELRQLRGREISMIFQDPMTALNPYMTIGDQVAEPLIIHNKISRKDAWSHAIKELELVGIPDADSKAHCYPHEFSGGMKQRVMIAMALITRPQLLIADEPTTALDVTVQKQVLDLIRNRQAEQGNAVILITHDLDVVKDYADRVMVMYAGRVIETATANELFASPLHAYTRSLLKSLPSRQPKGAPLFTIPGLPPNPWHRPEGCLFRTRNTIGKPELCLVSGKPPLVEKTPGHWVQDCPGCLS